MDSSHKIDPIRYIPGYVALFRSHVGRRMYLVFALSLIAAVLEGVGIVMLLPLLDALLGDGNVGYGAFGETLDRKMEWLGISGSAGAIVVLIALLFLLKGAFMFMVLAYSMYLKARLMRELRLKMIDQYAQMSLRYYVSRDSGHFVNIITAQLSTFVSTFMSMLSVGKVFVITTVYIGLAMLAAFWFGVFALVMGIVFFVLFRALNMSVRKLSIRNAVETSVHTKLLIQSIQAFKYLSATGTGDRLREGIRETLDRIVARMVKIGLISAFTSASREPFAVMALLLVIFVQVVVMSQPLGPILIAGILFFRALQNATALQASWQSMLSGIGSVEIFRDEWDHQIREKELDGDIEIGPLGSDIELRDVRFAYNDEQGDVLRGINMVIPAKHTVAFVGESGSGKSTLVDLLTLGLRPRKGQVLIDGVPAEKVRLAAWRRQIGFVSQESVIFDDTVANNISLWAGDMESDLALKERIEEAARLAYVDHVVKLLPDGYQTVVGERGVRLSGGQRQRLFLARELFKKPELLILDEATSALDSESESAIRESIDAIKGSMTVVIVAHRLSTIRRADKIFVIGQGKVLEEGDFAALKGQNHSRFARLVALQRL